eukprot:1812244-Pyramimonas_sp.AAC.1
MESLCDQSDLLYFGVFVSSLPLCARASPGRAHASVWRSWGRGQAKPTEGIVGHVLAAAEPSDHVPVFVRFSPGFRSQAAAPAWVTARP